MFQIPYSVSLTVKYAFFIQASSILFLQALHGKASLKVPCLVILATNMTLFLAIFEVVEEMALASA